jgi:predicted MPP superfamily phosphohydrolase
MAPVKKYLKALWFTLAVNASIAFGDLVLTPIHAAGRAQVALGYALGLLHLLNMPGFTFSGMAGLRPHDDWTKRGFAVAMAVDLVFWGGAALAYLRLRRRLQPAPTESAPNATAPAPAISRRTLLVGGGRVVAASGAGLGAWAFLVESRWFEVTRRQIPIANLPPSLDGLRIVQLTDIHHCRWTSVQWLRGIVEATNALNPDVVALTGDYVYRGLQYVEPAAFELGKLRARVGVVGVMGNHDWWQNGELTRWAFAKAGIPLIDNARRFVTPDRKLVPASRTGLCLAGVGDFWEDVCLYDEALGGVPGGMPRVLLSHNPDVAEQSEFVASGHRVDLMLSGHTHGGQVRLPGIGTPVTNSVYGQKYASGLVEGPVCPVYVSRGLGMTAMPIRFGVRPEIAVIELRRRDASL